MEAENEASLSKIQQLEAEISRLREENSRLQSEKLQRQIQDDKNSSSNCESPKKILENRSSQNEDVEPQQPLAPVEQLSNAHIERYSRQLLLPDGFHVAGQLKLLSSSVLVVGAGGIGSTLLMYLAASGVGRISVVDFDMVEVSNLHRQVLHSTLTVGMNKAVSACHAMQALNPTIDCRALPVALTHDNAMELFAEHDCIVDASDNPRTRYLINDACVLTGIPLISGSAVGTEGQLSVHNHNGGPCYRCLYPMPKATSAGAKSCSDHGVLGPVPGLIGVLQALETLKVLTDTGSTMNHRLLMYDSLQCSFLNIKKPPKQSTCPVCSSNATIQSLEDSWKDSQAARGPSMCDMYIPAPLDADFQISCTDYQRLGSTSSDFASCQQQQEQNPKHVLLDVRVPEQFDLCSLDGAVNIPLGQLTEQIDRVETLSNGWTVPVYCICRRGIFSVEATKLLNEKYALPKQRDDPKVQPVKNITGGLEAWRRQVDEAFPKY